MFVLKEKHVGLAWKNKKKQVHKHRCNAHMHGFDFNSNVGKLVYNQKFIGDSINKTRGFIYRIWRTQIEGVA